MRFRLWPSVSVVFALVSTVSMVFAGGIASPTDPTKTSPSPGRCALEIEPMGRAVVAVKTDRGNYISWRLLRGDSESVGFDIFRQATPDARRVKLNSEPLTTTTDYLDPAGQSDELPIYSVKPSDGHGATGSAQTVDTASRQPYQSVRLKDPTTTFQKIGIADLNGDGDYDYVIKQPNSNIDPWHKYWHRSPGTYKLEAYLHDGTFLWQKDLGWAIEQGIWYSPWIAFDLNGDGRSEVMAKVGEGDPRDADGKVTSGPEWMVVWDGMTGREIARAPWPDRKDFPDYNRASRNQIAVAFLDGKRAAVLALRGTYSLMRVDAYTLKDGQLKKLWDYSNRDRGDQYKGQGAHFTIAADVDADGKDEVILGSAVLDDDGRPLWTTGKGHPDAAYLTDIDPSHPGLEIGYVMERKQKTGGLCIADAATGDLLWELQEPTGHVHSKGLCADIDARHPGMEVYGADSVDHKMTDRRWMFSASGRLLKKGSELDFPFGVTTVYWDGDLQSEMVRGSITKYRDIGDLGRVEGRVIQVTDVLGDWREEIITSVPGELRIYSTTLPAMHRHVCLMQDPIYRMATAMNAMGYTQNATLTECLESTATNIQLISTEREPGQMNLQVVVSAPRDRAVVGKLTLSTDRGLSLSPGQLAIQLQPGQRVVRSVVMKGDTTSGEPSVRALLKANGQVLEVQRCWPAK